MSEWGGDAVPSRIFQAQLTLVGISAHFNVIYITRYGY
ncbi:hypothetical protein PAN31108_04720 [Pandoraea anhela]|uniref:Uncharacterized protein n=1 Tax=Pandoraea anhela TaxID=2508295 RepID=A0A5E4YTY1_9BURK|nr:hypothetical protein PAN31108_04720 [Pandoraea anhela]